MIRDLKTRKAYQTYEKGFLKTFGELKLSGQACYLMGLL